MTRIEILRQALDLTTRDRNQTHGEPKDAFALIAALWSPMLGVPVAPHQVALLLALLKVARAAGNPKHTDNWVDLAGYAACGAECVRDCDTTEWEGKQ